MTIYDVAPEQWDQIKELTIQVFKSGQFEKDMLRCSIYAFLLWLSAHPIDFMLGVPEDWDLH